MLMMDKKKTLTQILGPEKVEEELPKEALHTIAEELIACVQEGDAEGLTHCLRAAFSEILSKAEE